MADYCGINLWDDSLAEQVYPGADLKYHRWTTYYKELTSPLIGISPGESAWVRAWRHDDTTLSSWYAFVFYDDEENAVGSRYARYNSKDSDSGYSVTAPSGTSFMRVSAASFGNAEIHLEIAGGGVLMADEDVKVYTRGGRLAFTAGTLRNHVGETATLSFWIRLGDGAVEGHYVSFYHYQASGVSISYDRAVSDITAEWSYRELTGTVVDRGTRNTGAVYDGSSEFYIDYDYNR